MTESQFLAAISSWSTPLGRHQPDQFAVFLGRLKLGARHQSTSAPATFRRPATSSRLRPSGLAKIFIFPPLLPAADDDIRLCGIDGKTVAGPVRRLGCNESRTRTEKGIVDNSPLVS